MGMLMDDLTMWHVFLDKSPHSIVVKKYLNDGNNGFTGGHIIRASQVKAEHHGLTIEQLRGKTDWDLLPHEQARKIVEDDLWVMKNRKFIKNRLERITHSNGETVWVSVTKWPLMTKNCVWGVISISWDVTEQVEAEERAKRLSRFMIRRIYYPLFALLPVINRLGVKHSRLVRSLNEIMLRSKKIIQTITPE